MIAVATDDASVKEKISKESLKTDNILSICLARRNNGTCYMKQPLKGLSIGSASSPQRSC